MGKVKPSKAGAFINEEHSIYCHLLEITWVGSHTVEFIRSKCEVDLTMNKNEG